jgi:hypothetical protein
MKFLESLLRISALVVLTALAACATTPGHQFSSLAPLSESKGDIYLYRGDAFVANAGIFKVSVDEQEVGGLFNASYLLLRLPPGLHRLKVSPGGLGIPSDLEVKVEAGKAVFYEFVFQTGILANHLFLGAEVEPREHAAAVAALKDLKAVLPGIVEPVPAYAAIDNVDAVPYISPKGRDAYREWLTRNYPRAVVISASGRYHFAWGSPRNAEDAVDPAERALAGCRKYASDCKVYAIDDRVVWKQ